MVACRYGAFLNVGDDHWAGVNHFVYAYPFIRDVCDIVDLTLSEAGQKAQFETHLQKCLSADSITHEDAHLIHAYLEWGWSIQLTVTDGDCGAHVMALHKDLS